MPPVRTMPAKPMKTERTHEENQERAYIAASRRSDRSLEARIESARRASEIHKRRTGRSLRVTEADVINEEMYEEEDDDLPMQYRRLTAHLQTQNADFDRRLAAYLTNHVAMRSALGQAVSDAWQNNQFNNISQFMNPNMAQMPQQQQQQPQHPHAFSNPMMPPQQQMPNRSPTSYRQSPYPTPGATGMRPGQHARSVSIATPQDPAHQQKSSQSAQNSPVDNLKLEDRRMSLPVQNMMPPTPKSHAPSSNQSSPALSRNGSATNLTHQAFHPQPQPTPQMQARPSSRQPHPTFPSPFPQGMGNMNFDPLSSTLPMESQQLLAGAPFDMNMQHMFMPPQHTPSSSKPSQPFYSYNPNGRAKGTSSPTTAPSMPQPPMLGMNQTLAPAMLDTNAQFTNSPATDSVISPYTPATGYGFGFNDAFSMDPLKEPSSGQITPGDNDWQGLLNESWDDATAV